MSDDYETQEWYVLKENKEHEGPLSLRDIDALYKTMSIKSNSYFWKDGMEEWKPLYQIDVLKSLLNNAVAEAENIPDIQNEEDQLKSKAQSQKIKETEEIKSANPDEETGK